MKIRNYIFIGFAVIIVLYLTDWVINYNLTKQVTRNTDFLTSSEMVIRSSTQVHKRIIAMQSGFRGYLLTKEDKFLHHYNSGLIDIPPMLAQQRSLVPIKAQKSKIDTIVKLHNIWIKQTSALIKARRDTSGLGIIKYQRMFYLHFMTGGTKRLIDRITDEFNDLDKIEYSIRKVRRQKLKDSINRTHNISLILGIFIIAIALINALYITRVISIRINTMVGLAGNISQGNFKLLINDTENDELSDLSKSLNVMSQQLDKTFTKLAQKNNELDQFGYVVSHDLKAPLRGIDNIVKWIQEDHTKELSPAVNDYIELIKGRIIRLEKLINGLLEYSKIGREKLVVSEIDVAKMIKEIAEIIVPKSFSFTMTGACPVFQGEKLRLEQVFTNLISNAVKYHDKQDGKISVHCSGSDKDYYEFAVTDDGPGISPEYHEKIFVIFQTLKEKDAFESTGVGLAIVKKIIDEQKGNINVKSAPGNGATFTFTWPKKPLT